MKFPPPQFLSAADYKSMPWKNGLGTTRQIELSPPEASFPDGDFLWRLSLARVEKDNAFSAFPGCQRWLTVWNGEGLRLNDQWLAPYQPLHFAGDQAVNATLPEGPIDDLGLIYRPDKIKAQMRALHLTSQITQNLELTEGTHFIFCGDGEFVAHGRSVKSGQCLKLVNPQSLALQAREETKLLWVQISPLP